MYKELTKQGNYKYVQTYKGLDGKTKRISVVKPNKTRATEKEAYEELQEKINKILNPEQKVEKLGYYKQKFLEFKKDSVSVNTFKNYQVYLALLDDNLDLSEITKIKYDRKLIDYRSKYKPAVIKLIKTLFNVLFKFIKKYYVPEFDVTLEFTYTKEERFIENQKIKFIETDKIKEILGKIEHDLTRNFVIVQLYTGLRAGELLALTPNDVDFTNKLIHVNKTRLQNGQIASPKTVNSIRTIEVNDIVLNILYDFISNKDRIFNISIATIALCLRKHGLSSHMFRHTHVALLVEAGVPIKVISERLGHSNTTVTLDVYTHVTQNMKADLREKLEKFPPFIPL